MLALSFSFFFFNDTPTTEIYTLSLHDALPISRTADSIDGSRRFIFVHAPAGGASARHATLAQGDRKSTRMNSSHMSISYAVFCLKKKKKKKNTYISYTVNCITTQTPYNTHIMR